MNKLSHDWLPAARSRVAASLPRSAKLAIRALISDVSGRSVPAQQGIDHFLLSYPKCGRTWLRLMIGRACQLHYGLDEAQLLELESLVSDARPIPKIRVEHDGDPHLRPFWMIPPLRLAYRNKSVLLLIRDPRDVAVSMYFQTTRREGHADPGLDRFLHQSVGSVRSILAYYNSWARSRTLPRRLLVVRYEDLREEPVLWLRRALDFLDMSHIPDHIVSEAVDYCEFDRMRKLEEADAFGSVRLRSGKSGDEESFKTRKGKVGGYVDYLSAEQREWFERQMRRLDASFGYDRNGQKGA